MCDRNRERGSPPCTHLPAIHALKWTQDAQWEWVVNNLSESLVKVTSKSLSGTGDIRLSARAIYKTMGDARAVLDSEEHPNTEVQKSRVPTLEEWQERWVNHKIGFHQEQGHQLLKKYLEQILANLTGSGTEEP